MFMKLSKDRITHFTNIERMELDGKALKKEVELIPAISVKGKFSDDVPRPVKNGRVKVQSIQDGKSSDEVMWFDWAEVKEDGTFVIERYADSVDCSLRRFHSFER